MAFMKKIKNIFKKKDSSLKKIRNKQQENHDNNKTINNYHYHTYNTNIIPNNNPSNSSSNSVETIGHNQNINSNIGYISQSQIPQSKSQLSQSQQIPQQNQDVQYNTNNNSNIYHTSSPQIQPNPISLEKNTIEDHHQQQQQQQYQKQNQQHFNNNQIKNPKNKISPNTFSPIQSQTQLAHQQAQSQQQSQQQQQFLSKSSSSSSTSTTNISSSSPKQLNSPSLEDQMEEYKRIHRDKYKTSRERSNIINSSYNYLNNSNFNLNKELTTTTTTTTTTSTNNYTNSNNNNSSNRLISGSFQNSSSPLINNNNNITPRITPYSPLKTSSNLLKRSSHKLRMNKSEYQRLYFSSKDGGLWINDLPLKIKGVSWFGGECETYCVHGLWARDYKQYLDFLKENTFNAIRIPFSYEMVVKDPFPTSITINQQMNKDLYGLRALSVLDLIIEAAGERGILILLDFHSFGPNDRLNHGLWYSSKHSESDVMKMWNILILRYGQMWNVLGIDLKNEPFAATWNSGNEKTDWDKAINRIGAYIQNNGGNQWLIFGQGIPSQAPDRIACWGESFEQEGVKGQSSINLPLNDKFVYSPHCYGPSVVNHAHFNHKDYPHNLKPHWDQNFGNLVANTKRGMVIGEWGGKYITPMDQLWMDTFVDYLISKGTTDSFYWCLNPNSGDTGGLYLDDWVSTNLPKLNLLNKLCPHPTKIKLDKDTMIYKITSVVTAISEA
ncbi:hypothetical protein RB653_009154 [Dictyostelium firmibasis]|uniref:Glycoside hydrolase family 5 domain-containing protein n=1 Tax=Dictyostelium firmibasis TaxID=79012 RepID=A0AAN7YUU2_9MYCE